MVMVMQEEHKTGIQLYFSTFITASGLKEP